jgi:hypothetical protein
MFPTPMNPTEAAMVMSSGADDTPTRAVARGGGRCDGRVRRAAWTPPALAGDLGGASTVDEGARQSTATHPSVTR